MTSNDHDRTDILIDDIEQIEEPGKWAVVKVTYAEGKKPRGREHLRYDWYVRTDERSDADCNWTCGSPWVHTWDEVLSYGEVEVLSPGPADVWDEAAQAVYEWRIGVADKPSNPYSAEDAS